MPTDDSEDVKRRLKRAQQIDDDRGKDDPFTLPKQLRADVDADVESLADTDLETGAAEGDRAEASGKRRRALIELERQLRGGFRFIQGIDEDTITEDERRKVYVTYGWSGGEIGRFDDARVISMAETAAAVGADQIPQAAFRYPKARLDRINLQLGIVGGNATKATGSDRRKATDLRDTALEIAKTTLLRVRFFYCSASRDADQTPELAKLEFQPRRDRGTVEKKATAKPQPASMPASGAATK